MGGQLKIYLRLQLVIRVRLGSPFYLQLLCIVHNHLVGLSLGHRSLLRTGDGTSHRRSDTWSKNLQLAEYNVYPTWDNKLRHFSFEHSNFLFSNSDETGREVIRFLTPKI